MSRLDDLIEEFCPGGVEFRKIRDAYRRLQGTPITAEKMKEIDDPNGDIRIFAGGKTVISAFEKDIPKANITRVPAVLVQSRGVIDAIYYEEPFTFKNEMWAYTTEDKVTVKYLYYVLKNNKQKFRDAASSMGSMPQISLKVTDDFLIPLPPLPVQEEIVRILDQFTALEAELEAELEARKKQYEYYRDELLTFGDDEVEWKTLGDISIKTYSGGTPLANKTEYYGGDIPWLRTQEVRFGNIYDTEMRITPAALKNSAAKWIPENCVIVAISGATAGRSAINKIPLTTNQHCCCLEINSKKAHYRYVFHWVSSQYQEIKSLGQGARADLNSGIIKGYPIPIPSLAEQARIVAILDRFDTLTNDLTSGLPAEIAARHKQYEYYRDRLLTFKEAVS